MKTVNSFCKLHLTFIVMLFSFCVSVKEYDSAKMEKAKPLLERNMTEKQQILLTEIGYCINKIRKNSKLESNNPEDSDLKFQYFVMAYRNRSNINELKSLLSSCQLKEKLEKNRGIDYDSRQNSDILWTRYKKFTGEFRIRTNKCRYTQIQAQVSFHLGFGFIIGLSNCIDDNGKQWIDFGFGPCILAFSGGLDIGIEGNEEEQYSNSLFPITAGWTEANEMFTSTLIIGKFKGGKFVVKNNTPKIAIGISQENYKFNYRIGIVLLPRWILPRKGNFLEFRKNIILETFFLNDRDYYSLLADEDKENFLFQSEREELEIKMKRKK